jgi:peptidoglycan hydrolase CwlO-like protein
MNRMLRRSIVIGPILVVLASGLLVLGACASESDSDRAVNTPTAPRVTDVSPPATTPSYRPPVTHQPPYTPPTRPPYQTPAYPRTPPIGGSGSSTYDDSGDDLQSQLDDAQSAADDMQGQIDDMQSQVDNLGSDG